MQVLASHLCESRLQVFDGRTGNNSFPRWTVPAAGRKVLLLFVPGLAVSPSSHSGFDRYVLARTEAAGSNNYPLKWIRFRRRSFGLLLSRDCLVQRLGVRQLRLLLAGPQLWAHVTVVFRALGEA